MVFKEDWFQWLTSFLIKSLAEVVMLLLNQIISLQMNLSACNICDVDFPDIQSLSKYNRGIKYLLCPINLFAKYAWVVPLNDKRRISIVNAFQKIISKCGKAEPEGQCKPNKVWVHPGGESYNKLLQRFLKINNIEMYSTCKEGKSVAAERFIRTLKNKIFKHMTGVLMNVYFDALDDILDKYNNLVNRNIKIKPADVTSNSYAEYNENTNEKDPKFKVGDHVRISRCKKNFAKGYTQNCSEEHFVVSKIKNTAPWT